MSKSRRRKDWWSRGYTENKRTTILSGLVIQYSNWNDAVESTVKCYRRRETCWYYVLELMR